MGGGTDIRTYVRTDVRTGQNPPILKDIAPFGAAAQKTRGDWGGGWPGRGGLWGGLVWDGVDHGVANGVAGVGLL